MLVNQKPTGRTMTMPGGLAVGTLTGLAVTVALSALLALLVNMELIERDNTGYAIMLLLLPCERLISTPSLRSSSTHSPRRALDGSDSPERSLISLSIRDEVIFIYEYSQLFLMCFIVVILKDEPRSATCCPC